MRIPTLYEKCPCNRRQEVGMSVQLDRIPDSLGYLVLTEDGAVVNSGGDLENAETMATEFMKLVQTACSVPLSNSKKDKFRKITVTWDSLCYVITISNHKIYICKRKYLPHEPAVA